MNSKIIVPLGFSEFSELEFSSDNNKNLKDILFNGEKIAIQTNFIKMTILNIYNNYFDIPIDDELLFFIYNLNEYFGSNNFKQSMNVTNHIYMPMEIKEYDGKIFIRKKLEYPNRLVIRKNGSIISVDNHDDIKNHLKYLSTARFVIDLKGLWMGYGKSYQLVLRISEIQIGEDSISFPLYDMRTIKNFYKKYINQKKNKTKKIASIEI